MFKILQRREQRKGKVATVEFEGDTYGAGVSFFVGNLTSGQGPGLHQHPYAETCIVFSGRVSMIVDGQNVLAGAGDIVIIGPATPHSFTAVGNERLDMVCIHNSERFIFEPLGKQQ